MLSSSGQLDLHLGKGFGSHGLHLAVSSSFGLPSTIAVGQQIGLPIETSHILSFVLCVIKLKKQSNIYFAPVFSPVRYGQWSCRSLISFPLHRSPQLVASQSGGVMLDINFQRNSGVVLTPLSFWSPKFRNTGMIVFSMGRNRASPQCCKQLAMSVHFGALQGPHSCKN